MGALTAENVNKAACQAAPDPLLTIRERLALLAKMRPAGELVLIVGAGLWDSLRGRLAKAPAVASLLT